MYEKGNDLLDYGAGIAHHIPNPGITSTARRRIPHIQEMETSR
jgi:hypothetical protein